MPEHILKCWPVYWDAIERGDKNFEVRRDDRGFQRGDILILRKTESNHHDFAWKRMGGANADGTWRNPEFYDLRRCILYVLTGGQLGIESGYVVMALGECDAR